MSSPSYVPHLAGVMGTIILRLSSNLAVDQSSSPPFAGFSLAFDNPPVLTSISGCGGAGSTSTFAAECVPDVTTLTIRGSGLMWYSSGWGAQLNIGNSSVSASVPHFTLLDDSTAILSLYGVYHSVLTPQHYATDTPLPLSLTSYGLANGQYTTWYTTNALSISFVALPPPSISSLSVGSCNQTGRNFQAYTGCLPGVSTLYMIGNYMYDLSVTLAGVPCLPTPLVGVSSAVVFTSTLPILPNLDPTVSYDLVAANDGGKITYSGLVQFTSQPTLASIDDCINRGSFGLAYLWGSYCPPATTITVRGSQFPLADSISLRFSPGGSTIVRIPAMLVDSQTLAGTLPPLDPATAALVYGQRGLLSAVFNTAGGTISSNSISLGLYQWSNPPNVTAVTSTSCNSVAPLQLTNCLGGATITVTGTNLAYGAIQSFMTMSPGVYYGTNYLQPDGTGYDSISNTSIVFTLEYFDQVTNTELLTDVPYTLLLNNIDGYQLRKLANAFNITLAYPPQSATSTTMHHNMLSTGATVGLTIAVVAVVLFVAVAIYRYRHSPCVKDRNDAGVFNTLQSPGRVHSDDIASMELH